MGTTTRARSTSSRARRSMGHRRRARSDTAPHLDRGDGLQLMLAKANSFITPTTLRLIVCATQYSMALARSPSTSTSGRPCAFNSSANASGSRSSRVLAGASCSGAGSSVSSLTSSAAGRRQRSSVAYQDRSAGGGGVVLPRRWSGHPVSERTGAVNDDHASHTPARGAPCTRSLMADGGLRESSQHPTSEVSIPSFEVGASGTCAGWWGGQAGWARRAPSAAAGVRRPRRVRTGRPSVTSQTRGRRGGLPRGPFLAPLPGTRWSRWARRARLLTCFYTGAHTAP